MANWKIRGGTVVERWMTTSLTLASPANSYTRPSNGAYVALSGNDTWGNGSEDLPYATIQAAATAVGAGIIILGSKVYREAITTITAGAVIVADGEVVIDGTGLSVFYSGANLIYFNSLTIKNFTSSFCSGSTSNYYNCNIRNCGLISPSNTTIPATGCEFENITGRLLLDFSGAGFLRNSSLNSYINCLDIRFVTNAASAFSVCHDIFDNCNLSFQLANLFNRCLFNNCNFRFNSSAPTTPTLLPNAGVSTGYSSITTISALRTAQSAVFSPTTNFEGCIVADPLFLDRANGNYILSPSSPAKNLALEGTPVGARNTGKVLKFKSTEAAGDWLNDSATNFTFATDSVIQTASGTSLVTSKVWDLGKEYQLGKIKMFGTSGDRNGQFFDYDRNLSSSTISAGTTVLAANKRYVVEGASITWNSLTVTVGQKIATGNSNPLSFTSAGGGVVREILETPNRVVYEMRVSSVSSADVASQSYFLFEDRTIPTCNRVGNVSTGAITYGNGDASFDRTAANVFPVYAQFGQTRITARDNNLT